MLLTLSQPKSQFESRVPHDFSPPLPYSTSRFSPKLTNNPSQTPYPAGLPEKMSTQHRGLPPPAAMTLPDPGRPPPPPPPSIGGQSLAAMPVPPTQWQGSEDSMRNWLATKAEEERRRQEEERTRQETLRLDQRRVEHSMLRESLQGGVPPHMVPMIFAGIGGANMANVSLDWLQQYTLQLQQQQQAAGVSPELRRESRLINPPTATYAAPAQAPQQGIPGAPIAIQPPPPITQHQSTFSAYPQSPGSRARAAAPTSAPRASAHAALPRLTTNEMQIHQPPTAPSSAHPLHQTQTIQPEQPASSPSIYFHHWVPPTSQAEPKSHKPPTPSGRDDHVHEGDYKESPRKRKAQGAHQAAPVPSQHTSPSFSTTSNTPRSKNAHGRTRSNTSKEGDSSRQTSSRRDSAALGSQGEVDRRDRESTSFKQAAPPSPPREVR